MTFYLTQSGPFQVHFESENQRNIGVKEVGFVKETNFTRKHLIRTTYFVCILRNCNLLGVFQVVLVIGQDDTCRPKELSNIQLDEMEDKGRILIIRIPNPKTNFRRTFIGTLWRLHPQSQCTEDIPLSSRQSGLEMDSPHHT